MLVGIGYSIYAAALWGSIPYVVEAKTVGTAFGICTAIQNIGLSVAPTVGSAIHDATPNIDFGFKWVSHSHRVSDYIYYSKHSSGQC